MTDYQIAISGLETIFLDTDALIQSFKKAAYPPAFQKFYLKQVPVFDAIENLYGTVVDKDTMLENMAIACDGRIYLPVHSEIRWCFFSASDRSDPEEVERAFPEDEYLCGAI